MIADIDRNLQETAIHRELAERMVLSTALLDSSTLLEHLSGLEPRDIRNVALRRLFELVAAMQKNHEPITTQSVTVAASKNGLVATLGGYDQFRKILNEAPNIAHATYYRNEVRRLAKADRAYQSVIDAAIRISHKNCDIEKELQFLRSLHADEPSVEETLVPCDQALESLLESRASARCRISFGIPCLDAFVTGGLDPKWLVLVGARFGKGKSALAAQLFANSVQEDHGAVFFSLEMTRQEVLQRVCSNELGVPMTAWRKQERSNQVNEAIAEFRQRMRHRKWWIDDKPSQTIDSIRSKCELLKLRDGLDLIIIDNLQLIQSKLDSRQPRDVHFTTISKKLKIMAKELDAVVVLLCQLDTEAAKQRPTSANWAGGKAIEGDADVAIMIHEDKEKYEIISTKIRNGQGGGFLPIKFDGLYQRFESAQVSEYQNDFASYQATKE
jgi:replicative DNA helicase